MYSLKLCKLQIAYLGSPVTITQIYLFEFREIQEDSRNTLDQGCLLTVIGNNPTQHDVTNKFDYSKLSQ